MEIAKKAKVLILSHGYRETEIGGGPPQDIRDYLKEGVEAIDYMVYPFPHANFHYVYFSRYKHGKLVRKIRSYQLIGPEWLQYIQHFFITFYFLLMARTKYDICFALDDLSFLSVYPFRLIKVVRSLIYYSIDYTPKRFKNSLMNYLYHLADKIACMNSDTNWVVSTHMVDARRDNSVRVEEASPFLEVPIGFRQKEIKIIPYSGIDRYHLMFVGILLEKQGLEIVLKAMPKIVERFPQARLTIIGTGEHEDNLKTLARELRITNVIKFLGFVEDHREVERLLTKAGVGLAPYKPIEGSFTYYADPGKIKLYLGCGLPVVTTSVPVVAKDLKEKKAGVVIGFTPNDFYKAIEELLEDTAKYKSFRANALKMSKDFDVDSILRSAIENTNI